MAESPLSANLSQLVTDHHELLYRYAYRLTGDRTDAEDLTQQAFLTAVRKLDQLRDLGSARGWLCAILRNAYLKTHRQRTPQPASGLGMEIESVAEEAPYESPIDRERLQLALDELPEEFRLTLLMYYFEDLSYREIAARLELPIGTVMSRLSRAKSQLREKLRDRETLLGVK